MTVPSHDSATAALACPTCGAAMQNVAGTEQLRCAACGTTCALPARPAAAVEHHAFDAWAHVAAGRPAGDLGGVVVRCEGCHATTESTAVATRCAFCASPLVPLSAPPGVLAPTGVVPFTLGRAEAHEKFLAWLHAKEVTPDSVADVRSAEVMQSVYVPWWLVTGRATTRYEGRRGHAKVIGYEDEDRLREIHRWTWSDTDGTSVRDVAGAPVSAAHLTDVVRRLVKGAEVSDAVPFRPELVAGHSVARYDVEPDAAVEETTTRAATTLTSDVERSIGGDLAEVTSQRTTWSDVRLALVLTPVWMLTFIHEGETWNVAVDGRTGKVHGRFPLDNVKVAKAFAGCFAQLLLAAGVAAAAMWAWIKFF